MRAIISSVASPEIGSGVTSDRKTPEPRIEPGWRSQHEMGPVVILRRLRMRGREAYLAEASKS